MAKNQSQRPGRDVRGGKGKAGASRPAKGASKGSASHRNGPGGKGAYQRGAGRTQDARSHEGRKPAQRGGQGGSGAWIEGRRAVAEALEVGMPLRRALVADADGQLAGMVRELEAAGVAVERAPKARLDALSSHGAHQGIAVQAAPFRYAELEELLERAGEGDALIVLLDHVTDQGNLGAIVRSAEVVGAAGVIIAKARAAGVGVGAFKTSAGAVLHLPIAQVANLSTAIETLKEHGFWVGGATEHARESVWDAPMGGRLCLVMGSEGDGISRLVRERCDFECKLPQRGRVESLNVAQAATVMCYEWLRRTTEAEAAAASAAGIAGGAAAGAKAATSGASALPGDSFLTDAAATSADSLGSAAGIAAGLAAGASTSGAPALSDDSFLTDAAASLDIDWDL